MTRLTSISESEQLKLLTLFLYQHYKQDYNYAIANTYYTYDHQYKSIVHA